MTAPKRTVLLAALLLVLGLAAAAAWKTGALPWGRPQVLRVVAVGHSWWWEFDYPDLGFKTANELHFPAEAQVNLEVTSVDVLHTLSIPELSVNADGLPGQTNHVQFRAPAAGELGGICSEVCGTAHSMMRLKAIAESQSDFDAWASNQQKPAATPQTERQLAGYDMVSTACARCHSLNPAEARTDLPGPNLAHLMSRSVFAGASFTLNETNLRRWMRNTQEMKAGNDMVVNLVRDDYEGVIQYLLLLR